MRKLAIITIHKGNFLNLKKTINSVLKQSKLPDKYLVITTSLPKNFQKNFKKRNIKFIVGKDNSIYSAMNIGLENSLNYNVIFLNSGDVLYEDSTCKKIFEKIKQHPNKILIFKVVLKYRKKNFLPKKKYFESKSYFLHPGFLRPPINKKIIFYNENFKTIADGLWMKLNMGIYPKIKINEIISTHSLGGISTVPTIQLAIEKGKISKLNFIIELFKMFLFIILGKDLYFNFLFKRNYRIIKNEKK
jgi:hypothetical protein